MTKLVTLTTSSYKLSRWKITIIVWAGTGGATVPGRACGVPVQCGFGRGEIEAFGLKAEAGTNKHKRNQKNY